MSEATVYFIRRQDGEGPIKIGMTRGKLAQRLSACRHGSPYPLELCPYILHGPADLEPRLHAHFAAHRLECEWFEAVPALVQLAERGLRGGLGKVLRGARVERAPKRKPKAPTYWLESVMNGEADASDFISLRNGETWRVTDVRGWFAPHASTNCTEDAPSENGALTDVA